ncbi:MAG TPA: alkaline phosphatase family protein [Candidatus Binataceae bacterium]|nr:alkaline phosphatase family protein [Candidatus Binataceae bacterium]
MKAVRIGPLMLAAVALAIAAQSSIRAAAADTRARPRIFILMVWDGLRPDFVTQRDTPNLFALEREGVRFARHHAQYPTVTMVNAATLATGAPPGVTGIFADTMYLAPALKELGVNLQADGLMQFAVGPAMLENSKRLDELNAPDAFKGNLLGIDSVVQEAARESGYVAIVGKQGPAFLFDDRVLTVAGGQDELHQAHANYLFLSDDAAAAPADAQALSAAMPPAAATGVSDADRDRYFARVVADRAIPAAKTAVGAGHPAVIVLWQHNPDLTQHHAGLGTLPALEALTAADNNLATVRAAIQSSGVADRTDLMVVSDHGFATIRLRISLAALLVSAGLKQALGSTDVVVAPSGGSDLVYLSRDEFKTSAALEDRLQKIVNFAEAQEWCGPIFSRDGAAPPPAPAHARRGHHPSAAALAYRGSIDGTFAQSALGLFNAVRSPDLIISFAEAANATNRGFTGPEAPAFALAANGQRSVANKSQPLVRPVEGLIYSDTGSGDRWTTGMGMHGACGAREIHNFGAAIGPDFKRGFLDENPTANLDVAPTISHLLGLMINAGPGGAYPSGRALTEALAGESSYAGAAHAFTMTTSLELQGVEAIATLKLTRLGTRIYLDDSSVLRKPLGSSP